MAVWQFRGNMSEEIRESFGRIEVAPEVLTTIARFATLKIEGVSKLVPVPSDVARLFRRSAHIHQNGILLELADNRAKFDIYVIMEPHVNIMETSKALQQAIIEAVDTMVGIPVEAVNVHVEDVSYAQAKST
jgi:uncharacterized alkaline shock family protein YloU